MDKNVEHSAANRGTLFLAMKFLPMESTSRSSVSSLTRGELQILVKEAHDLPLTHANPFVKW